MNSRKLFDGLYTSDTEIEQKKVLIEGGFLTKDGEEVGKHWKTFGGSAKKLSTIMNQQGDPILALGEKLTNCIDALIIDDVNTNNVKPKSFDEAIKGISAPRAKSRTHKQYRSNKNFDVFLVGTGNKIRPSLSIIDRGAGQSLEDFTDTFLSVNEESKKDIPYLHGFYHMGGTGALRYSAGQLVLSKRNPAFNKGKDVWTFTIIRKFYEAEDIPVYKYLVINGSLPHFKAKSLSIIPTDKLANPDKKENRLSNKMGNDLEYGTFIKLYDYDIQNNSVITNDVRYALSTALPALPVPVIIQELRDYSSHTKRCVLTGLISQLEKYNEYTRTTEFIVDGKFPITAKCYVTLPKEKTDGTLVYDEASRVFDKTPKALYMINYQNHGIDNINYNINKYKLDYIKNNIFFIIDLSKCSRGILIETCMANRENVVKTSSLIKEAKWQMKVILKTDKVIKRIADERRDAASNNSESIEDLDLEIFSKDSPLKYLPLDGITGGVNYSTVAKGDQTKTDSKPKPLKRGPSPEYLSFEEFADKYSTIPKNIKTSNEFHLIFYVDDDNFNYFNFYVGGAKIEHKLITSHNKDGRRLCLFTLNKKDLNIKPSETCQITMEVGSDNVNYISRTIIVRLNLPKEHLTGGGSGDNVKKQFQYKDLISNITFTDFNKFKLDDVDSGSFTHIIQNGEKLDIFLNNKYSLYEKVTRELTDTKCKIFNYDMKMSVIGVALTAWSNNNVENSKLTKEEKEKMYDSVRLISRINESTKDAMPYIINTILAKN